MFIDYKNYIKDCLRGNILKCYFNIVVSYFSLLLFVLSGVISFYLFIIDTAILSKLGVFSNPILHAILCMFIVIMNLFLFYFYMYCNLKKNCCYFLVCGHTVKNNIKFNMLVKYSILRVYQFAMKSEAFIIHLLPSFFVTFFITLLLNEGISSILFVLFFACDLLLLIFGFYSFAVFIQKYQLTAYVFMENPEMQMKKIIKLSSIRMNNKCRQLFKFKCLNIFRRLLCLFIIPSLYYLPYCNIYETEFLLQKENSYMQKYAYTKKPIVFYLSPVKEN